VSSLLYDISDGTAIQCRPFQRVRLYERVSTSKQARHGNLSCQARATRRAVHDRHLQVHDQFLEVAPATSLNGRTDFLAAIDASRRDGLAIVTHDRTRYIRCADPNNSEGVPFLYQWDELLEASRGVQLLTLIPPTASPNQRRSSRIRRSGKAGRSPKPARAAPGSLKKRRQALALRLRVLHRAGVAAKAISRRLAVPETTIRRWLGRTR